METKLVVKKRNGEMTLSQTNEIGGIFAASGMFKDIQSKAQAIVKILAGRELGIPPVVAMSKIYMVSGKVAIPSEILAGLIKKSGKYTYRIIKHDDTSCKIQFLEKVGEKWETVGESEYSIDDAKLAGLTNKDNWIHYRRNMLFARALSNGARWYCPDAIQGAYTTEELAETPPAEVGITEKIEQAKIAPPTPPIAEILKGGGTKPLPPTENPLKQGIVEATESHKPASVDKIAEMVKLARQLPGTDGDKELIMNVFFEQLNLPTNTPFEKLTMEQVNKVIKMIHNNILISSTPIDSAKKNKLEKTSKLGAWKKGYCADCWEKGIKKELTKSQIKLSEKNFGDIQLCFVCQKARNK